MQQMVKASEISPLSQGEILVPPEQFLASATDGRGVIRYANAEFCEVAGYSREELVGAPHKIVRHPDMPRGMFYLMWDRLKSGLPACVYVMNKAANGGYYWVLATVTAMSDGYLSIRIKPNSDLFEMTREIYTVLLQEEAAGLSPEKSASKFKELLRAKGFASFEDYSQTALSSEFAKRDDVENFNVAGRKKIEKLTELMDEADKLVGKITTIFQQVRGEPINLRILSGRLEEAGVAIGTISKNYETMASDMHQMIEGLRCAETGVLVRMRHALVNAHCSSQIALLMTLTQGQSSNKHAQADRNKDGRHLLSEQAQVLSDVSNQALVEVASLGKIIPDICRQLRRRINGLDLVKLLCRVESGRMSDIDSGLTGIIGRLEDAHHQADRHLGALSAVAFQIDATSKAL